MLILRLLKLGGREGAMARHESGASDDLTGAGLDERNPAPLVRGSAAELPSFLTRSKQLHPGLANCRREENPSSANARKRLCK